MRIEGPRTSGIRAYQRRQAGSGETVETADSAGGFVRASAEVAVAGIPETELTPRVQQAIVNLMAEVGHLRDELHRRDRRIEELERLADEDPLTTVFNRRAFVREVTRFAEFADRYDTPSSILFFDVNGMKAINDAHGHGTGDKALIAVAETLSEHVRSSDIVGRLGGDEFGVLLVNSDAANAQMRGQKLAEAVQNTTLEVDGTAVQVTISWGSHTMDPGADVHEALRAADAKMYSQKRGKSAA